MDSLIWLKSAKYSAVRKKDDHFWLLIPGTASDDYINEDEIDRSRNRNLKIGFLYQLKQPKEIKMADPAIHRNSILHFSLKDFDTWIPPIFFSLILLVFISFSLYFNDLYANLPFSKNPLFPFLTLIITMIITHSILSIGELFLLSRKIEGMNNTLHLSVFGFLNHRVSWKLGIFMKEALILIFICLGVILAGLSISGHSPILGIGMCMGAAIFLIFALYPLEPGPGSTLLQIWTNEEEVINVFRWTIQGKYIPANKNIDLDKTKVTWMGLNALITWLGLSAISFRYLSDFVEAQDAFTELALYLIINGIGALFVFWCLVKIASFYFNTKKLSKTQIPTEYLPNENELNMWKDKNVFTKHIPEMADLNWRWMFINSGNFIINRGDLTRNYYWLVQGQLKIIGRSEKGELLHLTTLHDSTGVGELGLIDDKPRTADVFCSRSSVVVNLPLAEFNKIRDDRSSNLLKWITKASHVLDDSEMFDRIPAEIKEEWIRTCTFIEAKKNNVIIARGSMDQWMGLVLMGELEVLRNNATVALLKPGVAFGEMAFLTNAPRSATIIAKESSIIMRWEKEWWAERAKKTGLLSYLDKLIHRRVGK